MTKSIWLFVQVCILHSSIWTLCQCVHINVCVHVSLCTCLYTMAVSWSPKRLNSFNRTIAHVLMQLPLLYSIVVQCPLVIWLCYMLTTCVCEHVMLYCNKDSSVIIFIILLLWITVQPAGSLHMWHWTFPVVPNDPIQLWMCFVTNKLTDHLQYWPTNFVCLWISWNGKQDVMVNLKRSCGNFNSYLI